MRVTKMPVLRYYNSDTCTWSPWHFVDLTKVPTHVLTSTQTEDDIELVKQHIEPLAPELQRSVEPGPIFPGPKRNQMGLLTMVETSPGYWEPAPNN